jgi:hypothetical protein
VSEAAGTPLGLQLAAVFQSFVLPVAPPTQVLLVAFALVAPPKANGANRSNFKIAVLSVTFMLLSKAAGLPCHQFRAHNDYGTRVRKSTDDLKSVQPGMGLSHFYRG